MDIPAGRYGGEQGIFFTGGKIGEAIVAQGTSQQVFVVEVVAKLTKEAGRPLFIERGSEIGDVGGDDAIYSCRGLLHDGIDIIVVGPLRTDADDAVGDLAEVETAEDHELVIAADVEIVLQDLIGHEVAHIIGVLILLALVPGCTSLAGVPLRMKSSR